MKEAQSLLCHYGNIIAEELLALIQAMKQNGTFKKLLDYLYQEDDGQSAVSDILLASAALLAALLAALGKAVTGMESIPKPPKAPQDDSDYDDDDDDDDEKKKKHMYLSGRHRLKATCA